MFTNTRPVEEVGLLAKLLLDGMGGTSKSKNMNSSCCVFEQEIGMRGSNIVKRCRELEVEVESLRSSTSRSVSEQSSNSGCGDESQDLQQQQLLLLSDQNNAFGDQLLKAEGERDAALKELAHVREKLKYFEKKSVQSQRSRDHRTKVLEDELSHLRAELSAARALSTQPAIAPLNSSDVFDKEEIKRLTDQNSVILRQLDLCTCGIDTCDEEYECRHQIEILNRNVIIIFLTTGMGQKTSKSSDPSLPKWPESLSNYCSPAERSKVIEYYSQGGETARGMTFEEFSKYYCIVPPVYIGGGEADGLTEMWRTRCLGNPWEPTMKAAPGLKNLRFHIPPPGDAEWLPIFLSSRDGFCNTLLHEAAELYPGPMVVVCRTAVGAIGLILQSKWKEKVPKHTFFCCGSAFREFPGLGGANKRSVETQLDFQTIVIDDSMSSCSIRVGLDVLFPDGSPTDSNSFDINDFQLYGVGSPSHTTAFQRRVAAEKQNANCSRLVDRKAFAGADRFVLEAAGVLGEKYDRTKDHV